MLCEWSVGDDDVLQNPDNKTVFGCFIQPDYAEYMYELYAFESEEVSGNKEALC